MKAPEVIIAVLLVLMAAVALQFLEVGADAPELVAGPVLQAAGPEPAPALAILVDQPAEAYAYSVGTLPSWAAAEALDALSVALVVIPVTVLAVVNRKRLSSTILWRSVARLVADHTMVLTVRYPLKHPAGHVSQA